MSDSPKQASSQSQSAFSRFLQPSATSSLVAPSTPSIQADATSAGWSSYFSPSTSLSSPQQQLLAADHSSVDTHASSQDAFPFPHLSLRSSLAQNRRSQQQQPALPQPALKTSSTSHASKHFSVPVGGSKGQRASPLIDMALCPPSSSNDVDRRVNQVAVLSRTSLKIIDMRPARSSFAGQSGSYASAVASNFSPTRPTPPPAAEVMDVKAGTKLPKYAFTSVAWGYTSSADCLATGGADGTVFLWDVASDGNGAGGHGREQSRKKQAKAQHDRAVNQVAFAGPNGLWLISAGQDGAIKLWDIRSKSSGQSGPSQLTLNTHSDPIRGIAVHPLRSAPHVFQLCSLSESGALTHWDIRSSRTYQSRAPVHYGAGLCLDWTMATDSSGNDPLLDLFDLDLGSEISPTSGSSSASWLATGGMDGTVKVFPFTDALQTKPVTTLHTSNPVTRVRWREHQPTELAVAPLNTNPGSSSSSIDAFETNMSSKLNNEVEIWDLRRPYVPKSVLRTGLGSVSALVCPPSVSATSDFLWVTHKESGMLAQHDVLHDAQQPLENVSKACLAWSPDGELAFTTPLDANDDGTDREDFRAPLQLGALVPLGADEESDVSRLRYFAQRIKTEGSSIAEVCLFNSKVAEEANCSDLSISWSCVASLFEPPSNGRQELEVPQQEAHTAAFAQGAPHQALPLTVRNDERQGPRQFSFQDDEPTERSNSVSQQLNPPRSISRQSRRPSTPRPLADFTEESSASEEDMAMTVSQALNCSLQNLNLEQTADTRRKGSTSDDFRQSKSVTPFSKPKRPLGHARADSVPFKPPLPSRSLSYHGQQLPGKTRMSTHVDRYTSSSESDGEGESPKADMQSGPPPVGGNISRKLSRSTTAAAAVPFIRNSRSRTRRGTSLALDHGKAVIQQAKDVSKRSMELTSLAYKQEREQQESAVRYAQSVQAAQDARSFLWDSLRNKLGSTLQTMADQGQLQFCVQLMQVLRYTMLFDIVFESRCQTAYIEILRRLDLHLEAAAVTAASAVEDVQKLSNADTTFHVSCGCCGKAILQSPFDHCLHCAERLQLSTIVSCAVCRQSHTKSDFLHCLTCGHAAHHACLALLKEAATPVRSSRTQCPSGCGHASACPLAISS